MDDGIDNFEHLLRTLGFLKNIGSEEVAGFQQYELPRDVDKLKVAAEMALTRLSAPEFRHAMGADVFRSWHKTASIINRRVEVAYSELRKALHPKVTVLARKAHLAAFEGEIAIATRATLALQREVERDYQMRARPPKNPRARQDTCIRALKRAQMLLALPTSWCQGSEARSKRGWKVPWYQPRAESWSIVGALRVVTQNLEPDLQRDTMAFVGYAVRVDGLPTLQEWNDKGHRSHRDIQVALAGAIMQLEKASLQWQLNFDLGPTPSDDIELPGITNE
jgi:hypothetical protein